MDNIQKYVYLICFTGYLREQSKIAKDAGAEEFKLSGGKGKVKIITKSLTSFLFETTNYFIVNLRDIR